MTRIELPLARAIRLGGPALVLGSVALVMLGHTDWPWRLVYAGSLLLLGGVLWLRYLRRRPVSVTIGPDGGLFCMLANGHRLEVAQVLPGIVRPYLLAARLQGRAGEHCELFVPGADLTDHAHWQLRRAVVRFRCAAETESPVGRDRHDHSAG